MLNLNNNFAIIGRDDYNASLIQKLPGYGEVDENGKIKTPHRPFGYFTPKSALARYIHLCEIRHLREDISAKQLYDKLDKIDKLLQSGKFDEIEIPDTKADE